MKPCAEPVATVRSVTTTNADRLAVALLALLGEVEHPSFVARAQFAEKTNWIVRAAGLRAARARATAASQAP